MTRRIVFIDPGSAKPCALAWFEGAVLKSWGTRAFGECGPARLLGGFEPAECYLEIPDLRGRGSRGNTMIKLAAAGAWVAGSLRPHSTYLVPVRDWKGSAPKPQVHGRIYALLHPTERALLPANTPDLIAAAQSEGAAAGWPAERDWYPASAGAIPDALDAIGGGLWVVGRLREKSGKASPYVR